MILLCLTWLIHILLVLLTVAFFTLFERKVMGLVHLRLGPNKTTMLGLLQPLLDAFKLLTKQALIPVNVNKLTYSVGPQLSLLISVLFWMVLPSFSLVLSNSYSIVAFIFIGSLMVFSVLLSGWASNSKYSFIGALRSIAQSVSYEAVMTTLLIILLVYSFSFNISSISQLASVFLTLLLFPLWLFSTLAETHRAPFDFSESESELVSGYNTEYSGAYFAFIFLGEYSSLLFSSALIFWLFLPVFSCGPFSLVSFVVCTLMISFMFILVRVTYCRYRYDYLMTTAWKTLLPVTLSILLGVLMFSL